MSEIADLKNLDTALRKVISNKGSAGIDGINVEELGGGFPPTTKDFNTS
ncbi:hypothetical protein [Aequorivita ciconiae]|nr:hypothetical protein [Aequorivita sp. H23M31]